jgi:O-antigen/teichoic acid export membrane protein
MLTRDTLLKPMLQLATGRALGFAMTFMIPVVLVRMLDQHQFGTYKQLFLIYATMFGIAPLGLAESLYYFLPARPADAGRFIANSVVGLLLSGVIGTLLLTLFGHALAGQLDNPELERNVLQLGLFLALTMTAAVIEIVMITRNRHRLSATVYTVSDAVRAACLIVPALLWRDVSAVMWGAVLYGALRILALCSYLRSELGAGVRPDFSLLRPQLAYALPFGAAVTLEITQGNLHQFVVAHMYDTPTFALYSVGCLQIPLVDFVATGAGSVLMVKLGERSGPGEGAARLALWHEAVSKLGLLLFPLVALLLVAGDQLIITLFTERFRASIPIFLISSLTIAFAAFPTDSALRSYEQTRFLFGMNVIRLVVVAASIAPLLLGFGLPGAAVSVVLGTVAVKAVALLRIRRLLQVDASALLPWRDLAATLGVAGTAGSIAWLAKTALVSSGVASMLIAGAVFVTCYATGVQLLGLLRGNASAAPAT